VVAWLLVVAGIAGSVVAGLAVRSSGIHEADHRFGVQASDAAASVSASMARLDDLTATMRAAISTRPEMGSRAWAAWSADLSVAHRYPGALGLAFAEVVPQAQLGTYEAAVKADPPAGAGKRFAILPPGTRPQYCFIRLRSGDSVLDTLPAGLDLCAVGGPGLVAKPRDSGQFQVSPIQLGSGASVAAIFAPVYRGGTVPATLADRRAQFVGIVGGLFDIHGLLTGALAPYHGLSATLSRRDISAGVAGAGATAGVSGTLKTSKSAIVGSVGNRPASSVVADTVGFNSDGRWTIQILGSDAAARHIADDHGLLTLLVGLVLTLMAFALARLIIHGRKRALDLVEARTAELRVSEGRFRSLAAASSMGILETDVDGRFCYGNQRLEQILARSQDELSDRGWLESFSAADQERVLDGMQGAADAPTSGVDAKLDGADGTRWVRLSTAQMRKDGKLTGFVSSIEDVTDEVDATDALKAAAKHDALTGLPNRAFFLELLGGALRDIDEQGGQFAVLFIDLDRFKAVNDTHGHAIGDELLVATADRIAHSLRPGDRVARLGGDEFAVLMTQVDMSAAMVVVDRLQAAVARPFSFGAADAIIGASVGMVLVDDPVGDPSEILQDADMAMYRAKEGVSRFEVFDVSLRTSNLERFETEQSLRHAIDRDELRLCFQPVVKLDSGAVVGGEALLRWQHPTRGLLYPGEFLPLAESTGLVVPIGDWTIHTAVQVAASWPEQRRLGMSINFSAQQLTATNLMPTVEDLVMRYSIDPARLCLEVLETHLLDNANLSVLAEMKRLGVRIAIDDFGSGYSSLLYLKRMAADVIKVDRALVTDIANRADDRIIVAKVIELAHELGMTVVAEGVEQSNQADVLRDLGCDFAQGFAWSAALSAGDFDQVLEHGLPELSSVVMSGR
jgi:diguanylate cyclase (GGDEF)-like protein/PAS domain S-box-containing protein